MGGQPSDPAVFADALETCIRTAAFVVTNTTRTWAEHCESPTDKTVFQTSLLAPLLRPLREKHGYTAALWCAIYSGAWPMGWTDGDWYATFLCPEVSRVDAVAHDEADQRSKKLRRACTGRERLGATDESVGVPTTMGKPTYPAYAMSCALCARLRARLGVAPLNLEPGGARFSSGGFKPKTFGFERWLGAKDAAAARYRAQAKHWYDVLDIKGYWDRWPGWDMHPFGVWIADAMWPGQLRGETNRAIRSIARYRLTNGEIMHGFMWQSLALQAKHRTGGDPSEWVADVCWPTMDYDNDGTNRGTCGHGAGHGFFYYSLIRWPFEPAKPGSAVSQALSHALPFCSAGALQKYGAEWINGCQGGVYHSAFNSLSAAELRELVEAGVTDVTTELCRASGANCPAVSFLGADEAQGRLELVRAGLCDHFVPAAAAAAARRSATAGGTGGGWATFGDGVGSECRDTPGWTNKWKDTCAKYSDRCKDGLFFDKPWTQGKEYNYPEVHCCACGGDGGGGGGGDGGGGGGGGGGDGGGGGGKGGDGVFDDDDGGSDGGERCSGACCDSAGWGHRCSKYEQQQHCAGGRVVAGHEWAVGEAYEFPERKCCACGGGKKH